MRNRSEIDAKMMIGPKIPFLDASWASWKRSWRSKKEGGNFQVASSTPARPSKLALGRSGRWFGGLGARLDSHLGGPRAGLDAILGSLGRPRRHFGSDFGGFWGSQTGPERRFFGSEVEKCEIAKLLFFQMFSMILEVRGHWKSIKMGSSGYRNRCEMAGGPRTCILEAKNAVLRAILASQNLPKWNYGSLQGPRRSLTQSRPDCEVTNFFGFRLPR